MALLCRICNTRKPRRYCPGVSGDICAICCAQKREVSIRCPLDCAYLQDAREHEKLPPLAPEEMPSRDVPLSTEFLGAHNEILALISLVLGQAALAKPGVIDNDVREALDALVQSYRTRQSGLVYDAHPVNSLAAAVERRVAEGIVEIQKVLQEHPEGTELRDAELLGMLVFLQQMQWELNNGRPLGRAFIDELRRQYRLPLVPGDEGSSLLAP